MPHQSVEKLRLLLDSDAQLRHHVCLSVSAVGRQCNDRRMNPVHTIDELYDFLESFLSVMPWDSRSNQISGGQSSIFRHIDQAIGYMSLLFQEVQYIPLINRWLHDFYREWADYLNSSDSWNETVYNQFLQDPLFELDTGKYETADNWLCWNDFFSRRLSGSVPVPSVAEGHKHGWIRISGESKLSVPAPVKTGTLFDVSVLLADSPYNNSFQGGLFTHITLDIYNYHHFHSPVSGVIRDMRNVEGAATTGGKIVWNEEQQRYCYQYSDNIGFQMLEQRGVIVIENDKPASGCDCSVPQLVAIVPVGVAQVGSIVFNRDLSIGQHIKAGTDLGHFRCGGSDVVILKTKSVNNEF